MSTRKKTQKRKLESSSDSESSKAEQPYFQYDLDTNIQDIPNIQYQSSVIRKLYKDIYVDDKANLADAEQIKLAEDFNPEAFDTLEGFYNNLPGVINTRDALVKYKYKLMNPDVLFSTQACIFCDSKQVVLVRKQARSLDEPTTIYNECKSCGRKFGAG